MAMLLTRGQCQCWGGALEPGNIKSWFSHPANPELKIYIFFDACHLLKNMRGALHSFGQMQGSFGVAKWRDIENLERLQSSEGLRAANKLTKNHIRFSKQKMNVKLAAQTLSASVGTGLEFAQLRGCEGFEDCDGTISFVKMVDQLFDIFNSRTTRCRGFKGPLTAKGFHKVEEFLLKVRNILLNLKDNLGRLVCRGNRRMCILGFVISIDSLLLLGRDLLLGSNPPLKYLLTYKLSQDHLELFFSAVRRYGGWNNNPSSYQFSSAYRALLSHAGVSFSAGVNTNCVPQDTTSILNVQRATASEQTPVLTFKEALCDHTYAPAVNRLSPFVDGILDYIAGWLVRKVLNVVNCADCATALVKSPEAPSLGGLLELKDNGGLFMPSVDVIKFVRHCEVVLRSTVDVKHVRSGQWEGLVTNKMLSSLPSGLFSHLADHFSSTAKGIDTHYSILVKLLCDQFIKVRRFHSIRLTNIFLEGESLRKQYNKIVLFKNQ